jgi:hypothetical protein
VFSKLQNTGDVTFRCSNSLDTNILFESIETTSNKVQQPQHIDKHHSSQETSNDNQPPSREEISKEITALAICKRVCCD